MKSRTRKSARFSVRVIASLLYIVYVCCYCFVFFNSFFLGATFSCSATATRHQLLFALMARCSRIRKGPSILGGVAACVRHDRTCTKKERKKTIGKRCVGNQGKNHEPQLILNFTSRQYQKERKNSKKEDGDDGDNNNKRRT